MSRLNSTSHTRFARPVDMSSPDAFSLSALPSFGTKRLQALEKLGIQTPLDLLYHFPRGYEHRGYVRSLEEGKDGMVSSFLLTVATLPRNTKIHGGKTLTKFQAYDETGTAEIVFFNQPYFTETFLLDKTFRFYGKVILTGNRKQIISPKFEEAEDTSVLPDYFPLYPLTEGLTQKLCRLAVETVIRKYLPYLKDHLPETWRLKHKLPHIGEAFRQMHQPTNLTLLRQAIRRFAYEEWFLFALSLAQKQGEKEQIKVEKWENTDVSALIDPLPYTLTQAQNRTIEEIAKEVKSGYAMRRILIGDVGSGKTICAAVAIYYALLAGKQAALMAPTEILARQHYQDLEPMFESLGFSVKLLVGATKPADKKAIYQDLFSGRDECALVIGTHALLEDKVVFDDLGLIVTDEQHRFGLKQRAILQEKQKGVHALSMSATPIPRTLALALYGDLSISTLDEMPKGRKPVGTHLVHSGYRERLNGFINKTFLEGGQVYIVCPAIEENPDKVLEDGEIPIDMLASSQYENAQLLQHQNAQPLQHQNAPTSQHQNAQPLQHQNAPTSQYENAPPLQSAVALYNTLRALFAESCKVALLHGKMKPLEKEGIMQDFVIGKTQILVSTTVIEVGVNVPNATLMVVENAERFGLSQLHQLRGRVGRGEKQSFCILLSDSQSKKAQERLKVLCRYHDGFLIAKEDLKTRGPGDYLLNCQDHTRQSGGFSFRMSALCDDESLYAEAFADAKELFAKDPALLEVEHEGLRHMLAKLEASGIDHLA